MLRSLRSALLGGAALAALAGPLAAGEVAPAQGSAGERWSVFESEPGRFRVELPQAPHLERSERATLLGAVREAKYTLRFGDAELCVGIHDIPPIAAYLVPTRTILEKTRSGVLEDMDAQEIAVAERELQGLPALDFSYRLPGDPPRYERAIAVLVDSRLFLLTATAPEPPDTHPGIRRFFASFRFWSEGKSPRDDPDGARSAASREDRPAPQ